MASVDKVKLGSTTYDISPSKSGTLTGYTSNDAASPTAWAAADAITTSDTNSTIFSKVTTMIKNVRWLYSKLGTTDFSATGQSTVTGALSALQTGLNGKAASSHSHTTAQLPVSSSQTNSNSYIPTSALVYSMQQQITSLNDATNELKTSVSEGKALIAAAVTDKGVSTAADATFATMANNITSISPVFSSDIGYMYYTKTDQTIGTNNTNGRRIYGFNGVDRFSEISVTFLNSSWAFEDDKISNLKYPYNNKNNHLTFYLTKPMTYTIPYDGLNDTGGSITGQLSIDSNDYDILLTTSSGNGVNYTMSNESGGQSVLIILYY